MNTEQAKQPSAIHPVKQNEFDEADYLERYIDVSKAVRAGIFASGWDHFRYAGHREKRIFKTLNERPAHDHSPLVPAEPVRLVIWDLDDTFWRGTITEGGIQEYLQRNHDAVIELAKRGIVSSICSKNDDATVKALLQDRGIYDYFVFPSVSWESKGPRIAAIVQSIQLRAETVLFIDDNPNNLAEAKAIVPGIQVANEDFLQDLLNDPRLTGKPDAELSRLKQYKLLEKKNIEKSIAVGTNEDFLSSCDIKVYLDFQVDLHLDRAVELLQRTNQLNYTKRRLPESIEEARKALLKEMDYTGRQAALVHVTDKYGDYGYTGFFVLENVRQKHVEGRSDQTLRHFCFSCRTLGMLVEKWLFDFLGKPHVRVVGNVLTDLETSPPVNWISLAASLVDPANTFTHVAPQIRVYGGCEANALSVYLQPHTSHLEVIGNFMANDYFVRVNGARLAASAFERSPAAFSDEAAALGIPLDLTARDFMADAPEGTAFVLNFGFDALGGYFYRHKTQGWEILLEPMTLPAVNLHDKSDEELTVLLNNKGLPAHRIEAVLSVAAHIRDNYDRVRFESDDQRHAAIIRLIEKIPYGCKAILLLNHDRVRFDDGNIYAATNITRYNDTIKEVTCRFPFTTTVSFGQFISSDDQIKLGGNHYDRSVFYQTSAKIVETIRTLPTRKNADDIISRPTEAALLET